MINHEIFNEVEPSFEKVLALKNMPIDFNAIFGLLEKYRDEIIHDYFEFCESDNYFFCQRAINLVGWHKKTEAFMLVFEIFEHLDEEDEVLASECSLCLQEIVNKSHGPFLLEKLKEYKKTESLFEFNIFEILIYSGFENDEIINDMIDVLSDPPNSHWLKDLIAQKVDNPKVQKAVVDRLQFIAPMIKYIDAPPEYHELLEEWYELGSAYVERKYKLTDLGDEHFKDTDDNFLIDILGHNDDRAMEMLLKRSNLSTSDKDQIAKEIEERKDLLKKEFLDALPDNTQDWLDLESVSEDHKDEFIDELTFIQMAMKPKIKPRKLLKIGRNDPCPCGSDKKYKKCCGL